MCEQKGGFSQEYRKLVSSAGACRVAAAPARLTSLRYSGETPLLSHTFTVHPAAHGHGLCAAGWLTELTAGLSRAGLRRDGWQTGVYGHWHRCLSRTGQCRSGAHAPSICCTCGRTRAPVTSARRGGLRRPSDRMRRSGVFKRRSGRASRIQGDDSIMGRARRPKYPVRGGSLTRQHPAVSRGGAFPSRNHSVTQYP